MVKNFLSVDLESFLHRQLFLKVEKKKTGDNNHTVYATESILDLLDTYKTKITFFVVGQIFDWYPGLIEKIEKKGHEIGYHSHTHVLLKNTQILLNELALSKVFLSHYKPKSFRAPRLYLRQNQLQILKDYGFKLDSSIYGSGIFYTKEGLVEFPVSSFGLSKKEYPQDLKKVVLTSIPFGSGAGISLLKNTTQFFIDHLNNKNQPANLFIHPWQIMDYPKEIIKLSPAQKILYRGKALKTLEFLLSKNKFYPLRDLYS